MIVLNMGGFSDPPIFACLMKTFLLRLTKSLLSKMCKKYLKIGLESSTDVKKELRMPLSMVFLACNCNGFRQYGAKT
jgi:RNase P subunit RPR2